MQKKRPLVSVIVPTYNQDEYIGRCLRSLLLQSMNHDNYEIIVVNDGSSDRTQYALSLFSNPSQSRIKVINNPKNLGLPASLNIGIKSSSSDLVIRVDSDDYVNKNLLNFLYIYLSSNEECNAIACDYLLVDDNENFLSRENCLKNPIGCGILFRKKSMFEAGLYDEKFKSQEEVEFRIRFESKYEIERLKIPLYRYRRHKSNMTNNIERMDQYKNKLNEKHNILLNKLK